jgi:protein-L-isoaspartate(D-aspartate) O-methyltransferase
MTDFVRARHWMVEAQIRTSDVTDHALQDALRRLPRELFVPANRQALAYAETELEAAPGRFLLRPRDLGKLLQALAPKPGGDWLPGRAAGAGCGVGQAGAGRARRGAGGRRGARLVRPIGRLARCGAL